MPASSLESLRTALLAQLGGNELALGPVCTRVLLRTGVNLKTPRPDQTGDRVAIDKATAALADMGYRF